MSLAIANVLGVDARNVVLTFSSVILDRRAQQTGVLVRAGIADFEGSAAVYASKITQDNLNTEMAAVGLKSGTLISFTGISHDQLL